MPIRTKKNSFFAENELPQIEHRPTQCTHRLVYRNTTDPHVCVSILQGLVVFKVIFIESNSICLVFIIGIHKQSCLILWGGGGIGVGWWWLFGTANLARRLLLLRTLRHETMHVYILIKFLFYVHVYTWHLCHILRFP